MDKNGPAPLHPENSASTGGESLKNTKSTFAEEISSAERLLSAPVFPDLADSTLARIVQDMNQNGFGMVEKCIDEAHLSSLRAFIMQKVVEQRGEYGPFDPGHSGSDSLLNALSLSSEFNRSCRTIYRLGTGKTGPDQTFYHILRWFSGDTGEQHAYFFHYDSYVLTVLIPAVMPSRGPMGDLIMFPNRRPIRNTYLTNLFDKVLLDNRLTQRLLKKAMLLKLIKPVRVQLEPGNVYFFWGYRSVHANEPFDHDQIRATAVFHYVNPHADSRIRAFIKR